MKKNKVISAIAVSAIAVSAILPGCSLISTNNKQDMEQIIATVDISANINEGDELYAYKSAIEPTNIYKRDLISYYYNTGSTYISYGYSYSEVFNMLIDSLVNSAILTQYATLYVLNDMHIDPAVYAAIQVEDGDEIDTQIAKYESLLSSSELKVVKYEFWKTLNQAIDSYEERYITEEDEEERGSETRTTPQGVDTEVEDYYPAKENDGDDVTEPNYTVYTGYEGYAWSDLSDDYKENEALEGTTKTTRLKAYNAFVNSLKTNYLIDEDEEGKIADVLQLTYIKSEYAANLKSAIVNKFGDIYEEELKSKILNGDDDAESYIQKRYDELFAQQKVSYANATSFETAMGSMSDSSFIVYSPNTTNDTEVDENGNYGTFGLVYNILLPFSNAQSYVLTSLQTDRDNKTEGEKTENDYYYARNALLKQITTEDQRGAWFNGATEYAFNADGKVSDYYGNSSYLFFENNLVANERYESLTNYAGKYAYNGTVIKNSDGYYYTIGNKLTIDGMLEEFEAYVEYVMGDATAVSYNSKQDGYYTTTDFYKTNSEGKREVDYSKLVYATGNVNVEELTSVTRKNVFDPNTNLYKAMSAVNELQYAYTTDTSVLSQYLGYTVSAYSTSYIPEFEYAAHEAVKQGAGTFYVCAGDYGWHLIYVTYTFDFNGGEVYSQIDWDKIADEGTFEYFFFENVMSTNLSSASSNFSTYIVEEFGGNDAVVKNEKTYQDLLDLDNA